MLVGHAIHLEVEHAQAKSIGNCIPSRIRVGKPCDGSAGAPSTAAITTGKAQHPLHHGRRHRLDAAEHLSPRPDGRGNAQHRSHRQRRRDVHALLRRAELHGRAHGLHHRHAAGSRRHDLAGNPRQPILSAARDAARLPSSCSISATTPASSARTTWATTPSRCRPRMASRNSGATSITSMRCRG